MLLERNSIYYHFELQGAEQQGRLNDFRFMLRGTCDLVNAVTGKDAVLTYSTSKTNERGMLEFTLSIYGELRNLWAIQVFLYQYIAFYVGDIIQSQGTEPGFLFKVYEILDSDKKSWPVGIIRAETKEVARENAAGRLGCQPENLLVEQETGYLGYALSPTLQGVYLHAFADLTAFGREKGDCYCRRLNLYVLREDIHQVAAIESVLTWLEEAESQEQAKNLFRGKVPDIVDQDTVMRYLAEIK